MRWKQNKSQTLTADLSLIAKKPQYILLTVYNKEFGLSVCDHMIKINSTKQPFTEERKKIKTIAAQLKASTPDCSNVST